MTVITLRPRQIKFKEDMRAAFANGAKRIIAVAPCGFGKMPTAASIMSDAEKKGIPALFIVHREDLIDSCSEKLSIFEVDHGVLLKDHPKSNPFAKVQLSSWQTLTRKIKNPKFTFSPGLIIYDEAHRSVAEKSKEIIEHFSSAKGIGFTATPYRDDNAGLKDLYDTMVLSCNAEDLMEEGLLVRPEYYNIPPNLNISSESEVILDDMTEKKLGEVEHDIVISSDLIRQYKKICVDKQAIVFCRNVEHAKFTVERFRKANISAEFVECHTKNRAKLLEDFENKKFRILACATLLAEGYDYPDLECVILYRKMGSRALFRQAANRCMRISSKPKNSVILDFFDNLSEHGVPWCNEIYSLEYGVSTPPKPEKEKDDEDSNGQERFVVCIECMAIHDTLKHGLEKCANCGVPLQLDKVKKIIVELKSDLQKIDEKEVKTKKIYTKEEKQETYTKLCNKCIENCEKPTKVAGWYKKKFGVWPNRMEKPASFIKYEQDYAKREEKTLFVSEQLEWKMDI